MDGEQVRLDELPQAQYKEARASGATETISKADLDDAQSPKVTGQEDMKEYKDKREQQQGSKPSKGGFQKRIDRLIKDNSELREKLLHYGAGRPNGNESGGPLQVQSEESESYEPQQKDSVARVNGAEDSKIMELRQRFPDFDAVMAKARNGNLRIADEAAKELRSLDYGPHVAYLLAADNALRGELNKLPPAQQRQEVQKLHAEIEAVESGRKPFADKVKSTLAENEIKEVQKALKENPLGERVADTLVRELNALPNGPEVFRYLMLNGDVTKRLAEMRSRTDAVLELGRLSAKLDRRPTSHAPIPIRPVSGGSSKTSVPLDETDMTEFKKRRRAGEK